MLDRIDVGRGFPTKELKTQGKRVPLLRVKNCTFCWRFNDNWGVYLLLKNGKNSFLFCFFDSSPQKVLSFALMMFLRKSLAHFCMALIRLKESWNISIYYRFGTYYVSMPHTTTTQFSNDSQLSMIGKKPSDMFKRYALINTGFLVFSKVIIGKVCIFFWNLWLLGIILTYFFLVFIWW